MHNKGENKPRTEANENKQLGNQEKDEAKDDKQGEQLCNGE